MQYERRWQREKWRRHQRWGQPWRNLNANVWCMYCDGQNNQKKRSFLVGVVTTVRVCHGSVGTSLLCDCLVKCLCVNAPLGTILHHSHIQSNDECWQERLLRNFCSCFCLRQQWRQWQQDQQPAISQALTHLNDNKSSFFLLSYIYINTYIYMCVCECTLFPSYTWPNEQNLDAVHAPVLFMSG